jgi:hypothetical protein
MLNAILWMQWKHTRALALLTALLAFALPIAALQSARGMDTAQGFVVRMQVWGGSYALVAALAGLLVAMAAWRPDHAGRHVYALSLPISRANYVWFRFVSGAAFLVPTIAALLLGALVVTWSGAIPSGLHSYPIALTLRFALAAVTAYALFFSIASGTSKTAGIIIAVIATVLLTQFLLMAVADSKIDILKPIFEFIFYRPGILSVFAGRWMLVDV